MPVKETALSLDEGFKVGMYVEAVYDNPTGSGRIRFNLMQDDQTIPLHFNPRFDQNVLVINTKKDGTWLKPEDRPGGYDFSFGAKMAVKIQGDQNCFTIYINGKNFYQYNYKGGVSCASIKKVQFDWIMGEESAASQLQSLQIGYN